MEVEVEVKVKGGFSLINWGRTESSSFYLARSLMTSMPISAGSVACMSVREREREREPCNEEDLALGAVVDGEEVEVEDGVAAVVGGEGGGEALVALTGGADLVHQHRPRPLIDPVHHVPVHPLPLHLHEPPLALLLHLHPRRRLHTQNQPPSSSLFLSI
ncbi:unnamed protein product [Spirodela intermedia]|uniref:Uncharacterized protein n=1 Tax=Spirodela intermedia TaxID=51605 RepID=A0A7I8JTS6_SPIIN|nr:unnamed protein product [Spirodela intermedia]CAA6673504.1 unnamed protein product [Spirodela intermedia]